MTTDVFHARTAEFAFHRTRLRFDLAHTLFSSAGIDTGSALLLRHLQAYLKSAGPDAARRVLDLGCGYGTLGIVLQALDSDREVTMVDRDALAVEYTIGNLRANGLPTEPPLTTVHGSLGYDDLGPTAPFDLIVSNLPGKAGPSVIAHMVDNAANVTRPGAIVAFVVVTPLAADVAELLAGDRFELAERRRNRSHEIFIARVKATTGSEAGNEDEKPGLGPAFDSGVYDRHHGQFRLGKVAWEARTVTGLDEFDNLSHATRLLHAALQPGSGGSAGSAGSAGEMPPVVLVDPGQGHRAVVAARLGCRLRALVSRDLLSLRASARCLSDAGLPVPPLVHATTVDPALGTTAESGADGGAKQPLLAIHAGDKVYVPWLVDQINRHVGESAGASGAAEVVITGRSSVLGRLEAGVLKRARGRVIFKQDQSGYRVLRCLVKRPGSRGGERHR